MGARPGGSSCDSLAGGGPGRSRWSGAGGALSLEVCRAIRAVLADDSIPACASRRAAARLSEAREAFWFVREGATAVERSEDRKRLRWWTFAGGRANAELATRLTAHGLHVVAADDLGLTVAGSTRVEELRRAAGDTNVAMQPDQRRLEAVKFHEAVPSDALGSMVVSRDADTEAVAVATAEPVEVAGGDLRPHGFFCALRVAQPFEGGTRARLVMLLGAELTSASPMMHVSAQPERPGTTALPRRRF